MTRKKKTRSLADKVTIRTGRRKDFKKWRHDNPDQVAPSRRFVAKKQQQRKQKQPQPSKVLAFPNGSGRR